MRIFHNFDCVDEIVRPAVTLGSFDGVHTGHRRILDSLIAESKRIGGQSVVITFDPHPRQVIFPEQKMELLTSLDEKAEVLERLGIDNLLVIKFDEDFRRLSSEEFVREYLVKRLGMKSMIVGYNHHFGHNRSGDFNHLTPLHNELNFNLTQVEKFDMGCGKISSTEIRKMLTGGDVEKAAKLLDYQYFIIGQTYSTGAFAPNMPNKIIPGTGIYEIEIDNKLAQLIIDGDKNMIINDFNNCNQNIKITFKKRLG
jgi:riboflavin kinase/FMN adenylyltransferase